MATQDLQRSRANVGGASPLGPFRFARTPKSLAMLVGMSGFAVGVQMVVDKLFGPATAPAAGAAAAASVPFVIESSKVILASVLGMAINLHAADTTAAEAAAEAQHHRDFNFDLQLAVGRTLAKLLRDWSTAQPRTLAEVAEALAIAAEAHTSDHLPRWLAAAEAVQVEIAEEALRDLCLNHGRMPQGKPFLQPEQWTAFLTELLKSTNAPAAFNDYPTLWSTLANVLEDRFPPQFYIDIKSALNNPAHAKAWAAMQFRIHALVVQKLDAAIVAAQAAEAAAHGAQTAAVAARDQGALTHEALLRLASQVSADMHALWQQLDARDQADLGVLRREMMERLDEIRRDVKTAAEQATAANSGVQQLLSMHALTWDKVTLRPFARTLPTHYVAREKLIADLASKVAKSLHVGVRQAVAAHGDGGEGKTVLALAYANEALTGRLGPDHAYPGGVVFVSVGERSLQAALASELADLPGDAKLDERQRAQLVHGKLSQAPRTLLIIDNVADDAHWLSGGMQQWLPSDQCRVIATTRAESLGDLPMQRVGEVDLPAATELLAKFRADAADPASAAAIKTIHKEVAGLALALAAVGAYMQIDADEAAPGEARTWAQEAAFLVTLPLDQFHDQASGVASRTQNQTKTNAVIDALRARLTQAELLVLEVAAHLPPDMAPTGWLEDVLATCTADASHSLHTPLGTRASGTPHTPASVVDHLVRLGLLRLERDELAAFPKSTEVERRRAMVRSVHRLHAKRAQEAAATQPGREDALLIAIAECARGRRAVVLGSDEPGKPTAINNPHVLTNAALRWELGPLISVAIALAQAGRLKEAETVAWWLPSPLRLLGRLSEARVVFDSLLADQEATQAALGDSDFAALLTNLAVLQQAQGDLPGARASMERAIAIEAKHFAPDHPTFAIYSNLAMIQKDQGDLPGARASMERAIGIAEKHLGAEHPNLFAMRSNLAMIQKDQGDLPGARASMERAIEINEKHFAPDHPTFAISCSNLAVIQQAQGDLPGARSSMERAIAITQKHFAPDHPTFATSYSNLAGILRELTQLPDARRYADEAVRIDTKAHGPDSPILSASLSGLAKVQRDQGEFDAGRATMQRVFAIDTQHFEPTNVTWGYNHQSLGDLELAAGNPGKACESFQAALPIFLTHLGESHHRVKKLRASMKAVGCTLPP